MRRNPNPHAYQRQKPPKEDWGQVPLANNITWGYSLAFFCSALPLACQFTKLTNFHAGITVWIIPVLTAQTICLALTFCDLLCFVLLFFAFLCFALL